MEDGVDHEMEDRRRRVALIVCIITVIIVTVFPTQSVKATVNSEWARTFLDYRDVNPPSTGRTAPVMKDDSSEAKKSAV